MSQVAVRRVVRDDRVARSRVGARRPARDRQAGQEAAPPRGAVVRRHREPDVRRRAVEASPDLERRDGRPTEREAVGLDLGLVLRAVRAVRIAREPAPDELAVARHGVGEVGVHDVEAGSAAHDVPRAVVRARDQVVAGAARRACRDRGRPGGSRRRARRAAASFPPRPRMTSARGVPDEPVVPRRAGDVRAPAAATPTSRPTRTSARRRIV